MLKLNCDLGEGLDIVDQTLMPYIDQANIACGGHAGDYTSMKNAVTLALKHGVEIGAHPSYPDKANFGRISIPLPLVELEQSITEQITSLVKVCAELGAKLSYLKAHGALYNDSMRNLQLLRLLVEQAANHRLNLMIQGLPKATILNTSSFIPQSVIELASRRGVALIFEGFADRAYEDSGLLRPRSKSGAVHSSVTEVVKQAQNFAELQGVYTHSGRWLEVAIDSLCVHGDGDHAMQCVREIRYALG